MTQLNSRIKLAAADLLLINGDPLKDISVLTKPEKDLVLIMEDGKIFQNKLQRT